MSEGKFPYAFPFKFVEHARKIDLSEGRFSECLTLSEGEFSKQIDLREGGFQKCMDLSEGGCESG